MNISGNQPNQIQHATNRTCYFSKLDTSSGFYCATVYQESAKMCMFNTPFGRHCFLRLPFSISSASEVFHKTMQPLFDGKEGVGVFIGQIDTWGCTKQEHDERPCNVLHKARDSVLKQNGKKGSIWHE